MIKCSKCGKEIKPNTITYQVRVGYLVGEDGDDFCADMDTGYYHEECFNESDE